MRLPRLTRRRTLALLVAIPGLPALLWAAVLVVAPTGWARARIVGELEAATGRKVAVETIRLGVFGNLRVGGLSIAEIGTPDDPWLKVAEARLDVHLIQMLAGCCKPTEIALDGADLRVHRRADGSLEFAGLFDSHAQDETSAPDPGAKPNRAAIRLSLSGSRVLVIDEPSATRLDLADASGSATWADSRANVEALTGTLNGGSFEFAGYLDRATGTPTFEAELRARGVALGVGLSSLGKLVPVVTDGAEAIDGRLDLNLALKGGGDTAAAIKAGLKGHGAVRLEPIDLSGSKLVDSIEGIAHLPRSGRVGSVDSHFAIDSERVVSDDLTIKVARVPITLAGWTDFDGKIDYAVKTEAVRQALAGKLPGDARALLGDLQNDLGDLAAVRLAGTVDAPRLIAGPGGKGLSKDAEKARLREAARKLGERYLR